MFNAIRCRWYTAKVQAEVGAQFDHEVIGVLNVPIKRQLFINSVVASVPVENLRTAMEQEIKIFYVAMISLAAYLHEVMKGSIEPNSNMEAAVCFCLINRIEHINMDYISEHERTMVYSAMQTLEIFQTR
jgi:hypothetical protein